MIGNVDYGRLADEVPKAVMNLRALHVEQWETCLARDAYRSGHRDARHAAAEAVLPLAQACRDMAAEVERLTRNLNLMTDLRNAAEDASNRHANTLGEIAGALGCGPTFLPSELVERVRAVVGEVERLRGVVRGLRAGMFKPEVNHERMWETEHEEENRNLRNRQRKLNHDAETERLIHGGDAAK